MFRVQIKIAYIISINPQSTTESNARHPAIDNRKSQIVPRTKSDIRQIDHPIPSFTLAMKSWLARMSSPFVLPSVAN